MQERIETMHYLLLWPVVSTVLGFPIAMLLAAETWVPRINDPE
jgi:hypothetical protein